MKCSNTQLIIFDLDGTLINSALDLAIAVNHMLETQGEDRVDEDTIHGWVGNGALMLVQRALSRNREIDPTLNENYVQKSLKIFLDYYEKNMCNATVPYPNVVKTLHLLKEKGYILAIVTNKPFAFVEPILQGLKMDGLFEIILGGDSLDKKKPDPSPLLHVCKKLNMSTEASVMVGDSKNDILAANACTMHSVGVTYGYNYGEDIAVHHPTAIIDDFSELLKVL